MRDRLAEAIAARTVAQEALADAVAAVQRGEQHERIAQARFDEFAGVKDRIIDLRSGARAAWAKSGNGAPPPELVLPDELAAEQRQRDAAGEELTAWTDAVIDLRRQANKAQETFTAAKDKVSYVITEILAAWYRELDADWAETQRQQNAAADLLSALASFSYGGRQLPVRPRTEVKSRERIAADRPRNMPRTEDHLRQLLDEWCGRLQNDPNAEFEYRDPAPVPWPDMARMPGSIGSFRPTSLVAAERDEAERAAAEAKPLHPFAQSNFELASQVHQRDLARLEAEREAAAEARRQGSREAR
jgi:hypothetical protein